MDLGNPGIMGCLDSDLLKLLKRQESSFLLTLTFLIVIAIARQDLLIPY